MKKKTNITLSISQLDYIISLVEQDKKRLSKKDRTLKHDINKEVEQILESAWEHI